MDEPAIGEAAFRTDIRRARAILQDTSGAPVIGYRAPTFSISADTPPWALSNVGDGIFLLGDRDTLIRDNYIHDLKATGSPHYDGIQIEGSVSNIIIRHNTVINDYGQTSAVMIDNYFGPISNITVDKNLLVGGGYMIYVDGQFRAVRSPGCRSPTTTWARVIGE